MKMDSRSPGSRPGGQAEVHPRAHAATAGRGVQVQAAADARGETVGPDDQRGRADLAADAQPDGTVAGALDPLDLGVLEDGHAGRGAGRVQQRPIEMESPLPQRDDAAAERALGGQTKAVIADRLQRAAADSLTQPQSIEHRDTGGQDSFAAGLLAREAARIVDVDPQPGASQQQRQRRPGGTGPRDGDIYRPGQGTNLGFCAKARR